MSQARSSAVHLQIRLLLTLCLLLLFGLAGLRIYEITSLSGQVKEQNQLISKTQEQLQGLEEQLLNASSMATTQADIENAYRGMDDGGLLAGNPDSSFGQLPDSNPPNTGVLPPNLDMNPPGSDSLGSDFGSGFSDNPLAGQDNLVGPDGMTPPPPVDPLQERFETIETQLQREQHIGVVAAVEEGLVAIEPLPGLDNELFTNDSVLVARDNAGSRELIGKFIISDRQIRQKDGTEKVYYIADLSQEFGALVTQSVAEDDLVFILKTAN